MLTTTVEVTFLRYPFLARSPFIIYDDAPLLSVREIAATRAHTIGRRGSFKDYVDLYFAIAENRATLSGIIADAEQKFGGDFNSPCRQHRAPIRAPQGCPLRGGFAGLHGSVGLGFLKRLCRSDRDLRCG